MTTRRKTTFAAIGALLVALLFTLDGRQARADSYVVAGPGAVAVGYLTPRVVVPKGTKGQFVNLDIAIHDVVAKASGVYGGKKFRSALTPTGKTKVIQGVNLLKAGTFPFYCSIHPNMQGALVVV